MIRRHRYIKGSVVAKQGILKFTDLRSVGYDGL